ncbi:TIM barrel protein [Paraburkholderia panacisoli]|uniref:TIM barrel protein n=1 Tax=Paraburkholderia panacisoli TaxID=2603818 RepID=A0A5B0GLQ3_9BURK|nr:TIM barrel protein [Paraburkholderia panacisoli]
MSSIADVSASLPAFIENIEYAVTVAHQFKITLLVEAINQRDVPGYLIGSLCDALKWVDTIGDANFGLILDLYHARLEGLPATTAVEMALQKAHHVQVAAVPSRHEPDPGCSDTRGGIEGDRDDSLLSEHQWHPFPPALPSATCSAVLAARIDRRGPLADGRYASVDRGPPERAQRRSLCYVGSGYG